MGRPRLNPREFREPVSIRLRPKNVAWLRRVAEKRGTSIGRVINDLIEGREPPRGTPP